VLALSVLIAAAQEPKGAAPAAKQQVAGTENVVWIDDIDGDRIPDLVGSKPATDGERVSNELVFRSGADGRVLRKVEIPELHAILGLASAGDFDRDGFGDVLLDGMGRFGVSRECQLISGRKGTIRRLFNRVGYRGRSISLSMAVIPASREAGRAAVFGGLCNSGSHPLDPSPSISIVSLENGRILHRWLQPSHDGQLPVGEKFGSALAALSSRKDGYSRIAVGAPQRGSGPGAVEVFELDTSKRRWNGSDLAQVAPNGMDSWERRWRATGAEGASRFGTTLLAVGDVNQDGEEDLFVGGTGDGVYLFSGDDGKLLGSCAGPWNGTREDGFGHSLALIGDVNGDGVRDVAVGSYEGLGGSDTDWVEILSGRDASKLARVENVGESVVAASPHGDWTCVEPSSGVLRCYDGRTLALRFTVRE
jgi:hypothetical protein